MTPRVHRSRQNSRPKLAAQTADELVREIAKRSLDEVRDALRADLSRASKAELRGYVRARALFPVKQQVRRLIAERGLEPALVDDLLWPALERTTLLIVRQLTARPAAAADHVPLRIAG
jgi:hypothetical protein